MFTFKTTGPADRDCWAYDIILDKEYTVREFIQTVLDNLPKEWGYIGIGGKNFFGDPYVEYRYGEIIHNPTAMEEVMDRKIDHVRADGGWSRMDYRLYLEE